MGFPLMVDARTAVTFPPPGVSLAMELPQGPTRALEAFIVVATKTEDHVDLPLSHDVAGTLSVAEFYAALASIQRDIIEEIVPYAIIGG